MKTLLKCGRFSHGYKGDPSGRETTKSNCFDTNPVAIRLYQFKTLYADGNSKQLVGARQAPELLPVVNQPARDLKIAS